MTADEIRAQIETQVDAVIAKVRGADREFLLSRGLTIGKTEELMRAKDAEWDRWRAEQIAELSSWAARIAAAPDAPSHAVN